MEEYLDSALTWVQLVGPNPYLQAIAIAIAFILVGKVADFVISRVIANLAARSSTDLDDELLSLLHRPVFVSFVLLGVGLATARIELPSEPEFVALGALKTFAILVWYGFARNLIKLLLDAVSKSKKTSKTHAAMLPLLDNVFKIVLLAMAVYFVFLAWDIDVAAWLATAGIVGLALSFAAKDTLSNLFAGLSIVADAPYKMGDFIILESGERGKVTFIGLRSTRILTRDDVEITVPNGIIGNAKIINEAGGPSAKHRIRLKVGVAYGSDIDHVISVLNGVANDHANISEVPAPRVRFRNFGESSLDFELLGWIDQPVDRGRVLHELHCSVYKAFNDNHIEIPFPQRDLHVKAMPQSAG